MAFVCGVKLEKACASSVNTPCVGSDFLHKFGTRKAHGLEALLKQHSDVKPSQLLQYIRGWEVERRSSM